MTASRANCSASVALLALAMFYRAECAGFARADLALADWYGRPPVERIVAPQRLPRTPDAPL